MFYYEAYGSDGKVLYFKTNEPIDCKNIPDDLKKWIISEQTKLIERSSPSTRQLYKEEDDLCASIAKTTEAKIIGQIYEHMLRTAKEKDGTEITAYLADATGHKHKKADDYIPLFTE